MVQVFLTGVCLGVTLHIVDLWQYYMCCTRLSVTCCILFMVLFLCQMCWCGLQSALWSHIGTLKRLLAAEPRGIAGLLLPCHYLSGTILVTQYSMVWDWRVPREGHCYFIGLAARSLFVSSCFAFSSFILRVGIVGLGSSDWSHSSSFPIPTFLNNNNNN